MRYATRLTALVESEVGNSMRADNSLAKCLVFKIFDRHGLVLTCISSPPLAHLTPNQLEMMHEAYLPPLRASRNIKREELQQAAVTRRNTMPSVG